MSEPTPKKGLGFGSWAFILILGVAVVAYAAYELIPGLRELVTP